VFPHSRTSEDQQEQQVVIVHNVYLSTRISNHNLNPTLAGVRAVLNEHNDSEQILPGDSNLHHPLWGGSNARRADPESEDMITIMEDFDLRSTLNPGTITYEEAAWQSTINLCLVKVGLVDRVVRSQVGRDVDHDSDHLPISACSIKFVLVRGTVGCHAKQNVHVLLMLLPEARRI
jgi:hypothetical protein